jgi:hypothetical protein
LSKPRDLSKLFSTSTSIATDVELISTVNSASAYALSEANDYTDNELSSIDLTFTINTASAAAFASASAYTDSAIASFEALPSQDGNAGKYLSTSGSVTSWEELDLNAAINTASAAAYASASAYTDSQISNIDLSATIQTASAAAVTYLVDSAPGTLDTLNELSAALNDDPNFYSTIQAVYLSQSNASATYATKAEAQNSLDRWTKIYSASATTISGVDDGANSLSYTPNFENLYINGILQDPTNYTATSGSTIILDETILTNDVVEVISINPFNIANTYSTSQIDEKISNYTRWVKTLSASATVISGVDDNSLTLYYTPGNEQVYVNGILIKETTDYVATSASVITLTEAALSGDTIEVLNYTTINLANVYTQTQSDDKFLTQVSASTTYAIQSNTYTQTQSNTLFGNGLSTSRFLHVRDEKSAGTQGGTFTAGAWRTRTLNTTKTNTITGASLSSNQITLPSGSYFIQAYAPGFRVNGHVAKLYNITDSTDVIIGSNQTSGDTMTAMPPATVFGYFTIAAQKVFELQHRSQSTASDVGFGIRNELAIGEVYSEVFIWKVA